MNIHEALNIIETTTTTSKIDNFTFWIQFGQAIEVIKQYIKESEEQKSKEKLENTIKTINTESRRSFTVSSTIDDIMKIINPETKENLKPINKAKPIITHYGMMDKFQCPVCKKLITPHTKICSTCNTEIDWDGYIKPDLTIGYKGTKTIK